MPNYLYNPYTDTFQDSSDVDQFEIDLLPEYLQPNFKKPAFENVYKVKKPKTGVVVGGGGSVVGYDIKRLSDKHIFKCRKIESDNVVNWHEDDHTSTKIPMEVVVNSTLKNNDVEGVVKYIEHFVNDNKYLVVFEKLDSNWQQLDKYIKSKGCLPEKSAQKVFRQVYNTAENLERLGFFHNDIKASNIFIDKKFNMKLGNFGRAAWQTYTPIIRDSGTEIDDSASSLPNATSSEEKVYQEPAEVLCMGQLLHHMIYGTLPGETSDSFIKKKAAIKISTSCQTALDELLNPSSRDRVQFHYIQNLEFVSQGNDNTTTGTTSTTSIFSVGGRSNAATTTQSAHHILNPVTDISSFIESSVSFNSEMIYNPLEMESESFESESVLSEDHILLKTVKSLWWTLKFTCIRSKD